MTLYLDPVVYNKEGLPKNMHAICYSYIFAKLFHSIVVLTKSAILLINLCCQIGCKLITKQFST